MARFGKLPVIVPASVQIEINGKVVRVTGPKGSLEREFPVVSVEKTQEGILVNTKNETPKSRALQGTTRSHISNMVKGVSEGWTRSMEIVGAGYRGEVRGNQLVLSIGYSHPVTITAPAGITFKLEKNIITVDGIDKEVVGQVASDVRSVRKPEPYKGKGIKYTDEIVRRKAGKQAAKAA
ncbi:50S ribosomal protein L6 [Candidatus Microgenomates bacterium]|nr:50S ribosomal protein L6 [Candidatus Microgenomates bacterium]